MMASCLKQCFLLPLPSSVAEFLVPFKAVVNELQPRNLGIHLHTDVIPPELLKYAKEHSPKGRGYGAKLLTGATPIIGKTNFETL